jgi:hypothetical protein
MSNERLRYPYEVLFSCSSAERNSLGGYACDVPSDLRDSLYITWILGGINFLGYFVIVGFLALTEIPLIIKKTRSFANESIADRTVTQYLDWSAFNICFCFLLFVVIFTIMHRANYPENRPLNMVMLAISFAWFCSCFRNFVVVPFTPPLQAFVVVYDLIITKPFLRNHLILQAFSLMGVQDNKWFTISE